MGTEAATDLSARISGATTDLASRVTGAIRDAARVTGAGFEYLLNTAVRESNLDPNAKSPNSSATGLFQFLDQTWLATLKQAGPSLGYGKYADAIAQDSSGRYTVSDPATRREIMALRKDPSANATMAGAFSNTNIKVLTERLGRKPTDGELYIAHFLGAAGAVRLISAAQTQPNTSAANLFPRAAEANGAIFYDRKTGAPRSLSQVYNVLVARHDAGTARFAVASAAAVAPTPVAAVAAPARVALAAAVAAPATVASPASVAARAPLPAAPPLLVADNTATPANAAPSAPQRAAGPLFHGLYNDGNRGAVAPVVRELWGVRHGMPPTTVTVMEPVAPTAPAAPSKPPLSLFQFLRPDARAAT
jgi:hypothetical protein